MFNTLIAELASRFGLGDKAGPLLQMLLAYMTNKDTGGLSGFMNKVKAAGLGDIAQSWLGAPGATAQALSTHNVEQLFGGTGGLIGMLTSKLGISSPIASSALAYALPMVMGKLSSNGSLLATLPQEVFSFIGNARDMLMGGAGVAAGAAMAGAGAVAGAARSGATTTAAVAQSTGGGFKKWLPWIIAAAVVALGLNYCTKTPAVAPAPAPAVTSPAPVANTPAGAAVVAYEVDSLPALKVYFDTAKTDVAPEFNDKAKALLDYMKAHTDAKLSVSGFNDPTGDAAVNAELSKNRAKSVNAALVAAGVMEPAIVLEKPSDASGPSASNAESRRVEVTVKK